MAAQIAAVTQAGRLGVVGYRVWCDEHNLDREVKTDVHATNLAELHNRRDHPAPAGEPATLDLSKAADYLLVCHADLHDLGRSDRMEGAYYAALDLWQALTGLTGDAALDYARAIRETGAKAAPIPF